MHSLTIEEKIAQMIIMDLDKSEVTEKTAEFIASRKIGGILVYKKNYSDYPSMINLINTFKEKNSANEIPLFISIDQEGGRVNRLPNEIHKMESAFKIAQMNDMEKLKQSGEIIGKILRESGINLNYAPVLDIKRFKDDHAIGDRCYGENKEDVAKYGIEVMKAMQSKKVIAAVKHFPGHGQTEKDSHFFLPKINADAMVLENEDMKPFEEAIKNGCDAIMVGHLVVKSMDRFNPASLSKKIINTYLKQKYKFKGLIITDDLKMGAIKLRYRPEVAVYKAILAGNDVVVIGNTEDRLDKIIKYVAKKVKKNKIDIRMINESVDKIINFKKKYEINDEKAKGIDIDKINSEIDNLHKIKI